MVAWIWLLWWTWILGFFCRWERSRKAHVFAKSTYMQYAFTFSFLIDFFVCKLKKYLLIICLSKNFSTCQNGEVFISPLIFLFVLFFHIIRRVFRCLHILHKKSNVVLHIIPIEDSVSFKIVQCHIQFARLRKMIVNFWQARMLGEKLSDFKQVNKLTSIQFYMHVRNMFIISSSVCPVFASVLYLPE